MAQVTLTVQIAEDLHREAKATAEMRGESLSEVVRSALEEYAKKSVHAHDDAETALKSDPLLSLRFTGGPGDVAERAEEILQDASDPHTGFSIENDRTN